MPCAKGNNVIVTKKHLFPLQVGGWTFVFPCVQKVQRLSLNLMTLQVNK